MTKGLIVLILCSLLVSSGTAPYVSAVSASGTVFTPLGAIWGTSSTPVEAAPGSQNIPLTVSLAYTGGTQATSILATLRLPAGITDVNGNTAPTAGAVGVNPNSIFELAYNLNIDSGVQTGTYEVPIQLSWTTTAGGNFAINTEIDDVAVSALGTVTLNFASSQSSLTPGQVNNIRITLSNTGSGIASHITTSVSTSANSGSSVTVQTSSSGSGVSILNAPPTITKLDPGALVPMNISIYVPASASGSSISLFFSATYTDPYGLSKTLAQGVGLYAASTVSPILEFTSPDSSLLPGQTNVIPIELSNLGPGGVSRVHITIASSSTVSVLNQFPAVENLGPNSSAEASLTIYVPASQAGSPLTLTMTITYTDPYGATQSSTQALDLYVDTISQPNLNFQSLQQSVSPGEINNVTLVLSNLGSIGTSNIFATVSAPAQSGSVLNQFPPLAALDGGSRTNATLQIYVPASAAGSPLPLTITTGFDDQYGPGQTATQTIYLFVTNMASADSISVAVSTVNNTVTVGANSPVSFLIRNEGASPMYSPTFSLSVSTPMVITDNSPSSTQGLVIAPGKTIAYNTTISTSPSSTLGVYAGTLQVSYQDKLGNQRSQSFPVGLILTGRVELLFQNPQVSQSLGNITVSGAILNEGFSPAYYASVSGSLGKSSATPYYAGEIDPNTPVPFTLTIPYSSQNSTGGTARVLLAISYRDNFGTPKTYVSQLSSTLKSGRQTLPALLSNPAQTSSDQALIQNTLYGVVAAIAIVAVTGVLMVRRSRSGPAKRGRDGDGVGEDEKVV